MDTAVPIIDEKTFAELAKAVYKVRVQVKDDDCMPLLPQFADLKEAMAKGYLDDGLIEFRERLEDVLDLAWAMIPTQPLDFGVIRIRPESLKASIDRLVNLSRQKADYAHQATDRYDIALGLAVYHRLWDEGSQTKPELKHPLVSLIEAWFKRATVVQPARKRSGIIPKPMEGVRQLGHLPGTPGETQPLGNQENQSLGMLPGLEPVTDTIVPTAMMLTWSAGGGAALTRGGRAPLSKRIFFAVLTDIPKEARRAGGRHRIEMTLRDLRDLLYERSNRGRYEFNPKREINKIRSALFEVDQMRVPISRRRGATPTLWRVLGVTGFPIADLNSDVVFDIELPKGSGGGALIDRHAMRHYGLKSAPQFNATIGLAYYWDKYGTYASRRIQATRPRIARNSEGFVIGYDQQVLLDNRGRPVDGFQDQRLVFLDEAGGRAKGQTFEERRRAAARERNPAVDRYPPLTDHDLLMLCYPDDAAQLVGKRRRDRLYKAKNAIEKMAVDGYCVIEDATGKLGERAKRIPPTGWDHYFTQC